MFGTEQPVEVSCPTCAEPTVVWVDVVDVQNQLVVESDCQVCCRPLHVTVTVQRGQVVDSRAEFGW